MFLGYKIIETLSEGHKTSIYRATRELDDTNVIIKALKNEYPSEEEISSLSREYDITSLLKMTDVIETYTFYDDAYHFGIIFEDFDAISLQKVIDERPVTTPEFFSYSLQIIDSLIKIHSRNIIHKDLKPSNILINKASGKLKLSDFGISSILGKKAGAEESTIILEGTLSNISPEQTGRMNRSIDFRSDAYSLGVTFYQLLTGRLPFLSPDPMEHS